MKYLLLFVVLISALSVAVRAEERLVNSSLSYGQLGQALASVQWQDLLAKWTQFNFSTPPNQSFDLRESIMRARELIDIFAYAYPIIYPQYSSKEIFQLLYKDLSDGYELVGDYSDLRKLNYTEKDRVMRMNLILSWMTNFENHTNIYGYASYVAAPSLTVLFSRPKSQLSYQYWGSTSAVPVLSLTGLQNIALLGRGQWKSLYVKKNPIFNLTAIWEDQNHDIFHDYRKLLGYAKGMVSTKSGDDINFPEVIQVGKDISTQLHFAKQLDTFQGQLNDLIVGYDFYTAKGDKTAAKACLMRIQQLWPTLQSWVNQIDWLGQMQTIIDAFIAIPNKKS